MTYIITKLISSVWRVRLIVLDNCAASTPMLIRDTSSKEVWQFSFLLQPWPKIKILQYLWTRIERQVACFNRTLAERISEIYKIYLRSERNSFLKRTLRAVYRLLFIVSALPFENHLFVVWTFFAPRFWPGKNGLYYWETRNNNNNNNCTRLNIMYYSTVLFL